MVKCKKRAMMAGYVVILAIFYSLAVSSSLAEQRVVYVDTQNGTLDNSCWTGGEDKPCKSLEVVNTMLNSKSSIWQCKMEQKERPQEQEQELSCPVWLHPVEVNGTQTCQCYDHLQDIVRCSNSTQEAAILDCHCMTASETYEIEVGKCMYNCEHSHFLKADPIYIPLPKNISELNNKTCGHFNRQGRLCGQCKKDHYPPVYSYNPECRNCTGHYNWLKYVAVAFLPSTIFFILVITFRISATSPQLNAFVMVAQAFSAPFNVRYVVLALKGHHKAVFAANLASSLYGIWNLDFFRFIPDICLHVTSLQALALDYVLVVYPLVLTIICYMTLQLHTYNFRLIACLLRPFNACSTRIRNQIDARTSFVDAFATFLLLSYVRLISVSFDLLVPTQVYNASGHTIGLYLYYDASVEYFGKRHLPYAIIALVIVFVLILLPLLLLMAFPMRCFQRLLGKCRMQFQVLRIFMDSFQGCYKDGTDGKYFDCRYFPAIYMIVRILIFILISVTLDATGYALAAIVLFVLAIAVIIAQPYKQEFSSHNTTEAVLILLCVLCIVTAQDTNLADIKSVKTVKVYLALTAIVAALPLLYISFIAVKWIVTRESVKMKLKQMVPFYKRTQYEELQGSNSFLEGIDQRNEFNEAANLNASINSSDNTSSDHTAY